jgi:Protein of unknown function (DUF3828)
MRLVFAIALAFALCAAAPLKYTGKDPVALIALIYKPYRVDIPDFPSDIYSKRLQALMDKDEAETHEGEEGRIDWDVFIDGQDWKLSDIKIVLISRDATKAQIRATFKNVGDPKSILYDLVREDGKWRIDEVQETLKPRWIMSKILSDDPGAFPDNPPQATPAH